MGDHPASSLPPRWCRWPQRELDLRLAELGLVINAPEPAVICRPCGYALQPNGECVTRHLADKHSIQKRLRHGLTAYIHSLRLPDPNTLPLRPDWSPAHLNLAPRTGVACRHCSYRTTSVDLVTRHLAKAHNRRRPQRQKGWLRDEIFQGVVLQSWTQIGARGYWIATQGPSVCERPEAASAWLRDQATPEQRAAIDQLNQAERDRMAADSAAAQQTDGTSTPDLALHTNWMRRTGWLRTFDGASRDVLVRLALPPCPEGDGLRLSAPGSQVQIWSAREDEERLNRIASALRGLQGRCEDTARHTDLSIRFWLRSSDPTRPHRAPFEIVARQTTAQAYWRLFLRFLCFSFRLWRLPEVARASLCRRSLTETQHIALRAAWSALGEESRTRNERGAEYISAAVDESNAAQSGSWSDDDGRDDTDDSGIGTEADDTRIPPRVSVSRCIGRNPVADDNGDDDDLGGSDDDENDATDQIESDSDYGESEHAASSMEDESGTASDPYYQDILLRLAGFLVTEPFRGGQASSTLLVYFSGVIGLSADGSTYMRPLQYTPKLSALIYCARLILLETVLPRFSHDHIRIPARPDRHQVERLNKVRLKAFCMGCQAPVSELLSLRCYGRKLARTDGPVFRFQWSDDGQVLSWEEGRISMQQFRALSHDLLQSVTSSTRRLMYDLAPRFDLRTVRDRMSTVAKGYSFVTEPANRLQDAFLALSERACLSRLDGLIGRNGWDQQAVRRYMALHDQMLADLLALIHLTAGQAPRGTELLSIEHCNGASTSRGVYVHDGSFVLVTRHMKARTITNNEFQVARVLPDEVGRLLYQYLVYIRPFTYMLQRRCCGIDTDSSLLFCSPQRPDRLWKTAVLSGALQRLTKLTAGQAFGARIYRQVSIAVTEKHVRQIKNPFDRFDDRAANADISLAFAWQSGHRPMQRACTYGLDGAFPDSLQPALLRVYQWVSSEWHRFLQLAPPQPMSSPETTQRPAFAQPGNVSFREPASATQFDRIAQPPQTEPTSQELPVRNFLGDPSDKRAPDALLASEQPRKRRLEEGEEPPALKRSGRATDVSQRRFIDNTSKNPSKYHPQTNMDITPFVRLPQYPFVICKTCQFACVAGEVATHLRTKHICIRASERSGIVKYVSSIPGIAQRQDELRSFQLPPPTVSPIPFIAPPKADGVRCDKCGFVVRTVGGMRRHCRNEHGWVSSWIRGGNVAQRAKEERPVPWTTGVRCQRFFPSRAASGWFEVGRGSAEEHSR